MKGLLGSIVLISKTLSLVDYKRSMHFSEVTSR
jgi:hypothetical protein